MPTKIEKDSVTGTPTTGHVWDGITELNTPLPKWWLYLFFVCIVVAVVMFVLYPAIPYGPGHTRGLLGYSQRQDAMAEYQAMHQLHQAQLDQIGKMKVEDVKGNPALLAVAQTAGRVAFANNCQPCHGPNGEGRVGYPALGDDVWLWGGKLADIEQTITYGVRSGNDQARNSKMPSFGADGILKPQEIQQVADYVATLFGIKKDGDVSAGKQIFADNCVVCHGERGEGNREQGAPPLASAIHLYGGSRDSIVAQVTQPRQGVMPAWVGKLDAGTIKSLAIYVHGLGGGEN